MAYLRGNTVIDGDLSVQGDILYHSIRPDENGATVTYKAQNMGITEGRLLISRDGGTGALVDSAFIETHNNKEVTVTPNFSNNSTSDIPTKIIFPYDMSKLTVLSAEFGPTYGSGLPELPENIVSWDYI